MSGASDVTVVIVTYRCRDLALGCLASLAADPDRPVVVVVDNASGDGTVEAIRELHPWVEVVASDENRGFAWASNVGIRASRTPYVLLLNPDTEVPVGTIGRCVEALAARPTAGMLGCRLLQRDGSLDWACKRGEPTPWASLCYFSGLSRLFPGSRRFAGYVAGHLPADRPAVVDAINGAFMLVRREAIEDVGLLDEDFWMYMEDLDWCRRFRERGWEVYYHPAETVLHVKGGTSGRRRSREVNRAFHHSMWLYYRKHERARRWPSTTAAVWLGIHGRCRYVEVRDAVLRRRSEARA